MLFENSFILRFYNAWIEDERLHLVTEFCQGSVEELVSKLKPTESFIRDLLQDVVQGLAFLHDNGIYHLDIKPGNIFYSLTKKFKIGDTGLSRLKYILLNQRVDEASARYIAPELLAETKLSQIGGFHHPTVSMVPEAPPRPVDYKKADIFSLGQTILDLMISKPSF